MNGYIHRNHVLRDILDKYIESMKPGEFFNSREIAKKLSNKSRFVDIRTLAGILREREDIEWVDTGLWRRI